MIEHKEVREAIRKLINEIDGEYGCVSRYPKEIKEAVDICFNYSTEQEKKDELLKLYRKYSKGLSSGRLNLQQLLDLFDKIKALEEELE
jgi:hypothetical protein